MRYRINRHRLVWLRLSRSGLRRRLQPWRFLIAGAAGGIGAILGTVYEDIETGMRVVTIVAIGLLTATAALLTEPTATTARPTRPRPAGPYRADAPARSTSDRSRPVIRFRWLRPWPRRRLAPTLPPGDGLFRCRDAELAVLTSRHDVARLIRQRARHNDGDLAPLPPDAGRGATGPVLLLIHGRPGVGKSALALELGRRLAGRYPDGQIYANLGSLRGARRPSEVLGIFLKALGWPDEEMPTSTLARAKLFRSLTTNRRMLFLLDAARQPEQVTHLLPADPRIAVIITSRRDFGAELGVPSFYLDVPSVDDAVTILRAASHTHDGVHPECAAEIVKACGALPLALRSAAARVWPAGAELCHVADLLKSPTSRLSWLERPGISVLDRIASEWDRLLDQEQRALRLLSLVRSTTFVPWVLAPLLNVELAEAENLTTRLAAAQMLDAAGFDEATELVRYRFHPLVRLFAEAKDLAESRADERADAQARLDQAYREVVIAVIRELDLTFIPPRVDRRYLPAETKLPLLVAQQPEPWVRAEYGNLVRLVRRSTQEPGLCWRVAAQFNGCVPDDLDPSVSLNAFDKAEVAARADRAPGGLAAVWLARGSFLVAIERYPEGLRHLDDARLLAREFRMDARYDERQGALMEVRALRKLGEARLQMASFDAAARTLEQAFNAAAACGDDTEAQLIRMMLAETRQIDTPDVGGLDAHQHDAGRFRFLLGMAESARRRSDWSEAVSHLQSALVLCQGDTRRAATVHYRLARLHNVQHHAESRGSRFVPAPRSAPSGGPLSAADRAARQAAEAGLLFRQMGNVVGAVRARCQLSRALLSAGHLVEAERVAYAAERDLTGMLSTGDEAVGPLAARLSRALGEVRLARGDAVGGRRALLQAATLFATYHDWAAESDTLRRLDDVEWPDGATEPVDHSLARVAAIALRDQLDRWNRTDVGYVEATVFRRPDQRWAIEPPSGEDPGLPPGGRGGPPSWTDPDPVDRGGDDDDNQMINFWIRERVGDAGQPLRLAQFYTGVFQVGALRTDNLATGGQPIPRRDIPVTGLPTEWTVWSTSAVLGVTGGDEDAVRTHLSEADGVRKWTATFSLLVPRFGDSEERVLTIMPLTDHSRIDAMVWVDGDLYREVSIELTVQSPSPSPSPPVLVAGPTGGGAGHFGRGVGGGAGPTGAFAVTDRRTVPLRHVAPQPASDWQRPAQQVHLLLQPPEVRVFSKELAYDYYETWSPNCNSVEVQIDQTRAALDAFRLSVGASTPEIEPEDLWSRLCRHRPATHWAEAKGTAGDNLAELARSPQMWSLAEQGYGLYDRVFPRGTGVRGAIDALGSGDLLDITWQPHGAAHIAHVPWGLMYRAEPVPGRPIDPLMFLGLGSRIGYRAHSVSGLPSRTLGDIRAHVLYWGTDNPVAREAGRHHKELAVWNPLSLPVTSGPKVEVVKFLRDPSPGPVGVMYFYCRSHTDSGAAPALRFAGTNSADDVIELHEIGFGELRDRPLVFANACGTSASHPYTPNQLEQRFFQRGCRAFIGTETKVPVGFAARFATAFFHFLYLPGETVSASEAMVQARRFFLLEYGHPGGLFYSYVNDANAFVADDTAVAELCYPHRMRWRS